MHRRVWISILALFLTLLISACERSFPSAAEVFAPAWTPTFTPFQPLQNPSQTGTVSPPIAASPVSSTQLETGLTIWLDPQLPAALREAVMIPAEFSRVEEATLAGLRIEVGKEEPLANWVYALVAPFPTVVDGVSFEDIHRTWMGDNAGPFGGQPLLLEESTLAVFSSLWGDPAPAAVRNLPAGELLEAAWNQRPSWAIIPFEKLEPRWKVLEVDGVSPLHKNFDLTIYPLQVPIVLAGESTLIELARALYGNSSSTPLMPPSNRDPQKLTTLAMTGVTALVRATAYTMEQRGIAYPARDVGEWLRNADVTHISNEVPFARNCPFPNPVQPDVRFCSDTRYIGLLEEVGTDVVELTGDHFQDWGAEAMYDTLDLYAERGWLVYGGGANLEQGRQAVTLEHNGNNLAFIGCNGKGGSFAQAGPNRPGAVTCDFDFMKAEISRLRQEGYLPIATFQHFEYYTYRAQPNQIRDFGLLAEAGAVIVSGSQAHQPQALAFSNGALIHYGLGNLFFDQYEVSQATRQGFIDRHVFYDGRYIGTELLAILFVDYARPRVMTPDERADLLGVVFQASDW